MLYSLPTELSHADTVESTVYDTVTLESGEKTCYCIIGSLFSNVVSFCGYVFMVSLGYLCVLSI